MPKKILFVFGTRPEAIKLAPVIRAFEKEAAFRAVVCVTGQHRQMLDQVIFAFRLRVDHDLSIMTGNQTLADITTGALNGLADLYRKIRPDLVMVQGDTTTVMAGALAAFYLKIPVGHVEAGLRSFDLANPFPEEMNRIMADRVAALHFAPTRLAKRNLIKEGIGRKTITVTGNTVVDALAGIRNQTRDFSDASLRRLFGGRGMMGRASRLILLTAHRRENFGRPLEEICKAIAALARRYQDAVVVYPVHLNPNVQRTARRMLKGVSRVTLTAPLDYMDLIELLRRSYLVLTDSGGIQEEAPAFGKPVLILRRVTERPEAVAAGCARVIGEVTSQNILKAVRPLFEQPSAYRAMARVRNPFGDGRASWRIVQATRRFFGLSADVAEFVPGRS